MSLIDLFRRRSAQRAGRSGLATTPVRKTREWDDPAQNSAFSDESIGLLGALFCIALVVVTVAILDYGVLPPIFTTPSANINARLDFEYNDPEEVNKQQREAAEKASRVYVEEPGWVDSVVKDLTELIGIIEVAQNADDARERAARFPADAQLVGELYRYNQEMGPLRNPLRTLLLARIRSSLENIADRGILTKDDLDYERNKPGEHREIIRMAPNSKTAAPVQVQKLRSVEVASDELMRARWNEGLQRSLERQVFAHLQTRMKPNLRLDVAQTELRREQARELVSKSTVRVKQGDLILAKDKYVLKSDLDKLHAEYRAYKANQPLQSRIKHLVGLGTAVFGMLLAFLFIASRNERLVFRRRRALVMLAVFTLAALATARGLMLHGHSAAFTPFVFLGIVASLAFSQSIAMLTLFSLAMLTALAGVRWEAFPLEGGIPVLSLALMVGGVAAALPAQRLRDRWDLLKYAGIGGLVQGMLVAGLAWLGEGMIAGGTLDHLKTEASRLTTFAASTRAGLPTIYDAAFAFINGPLSGLILLGSLPLIESLFGILTNIRLFELADMNRPALRRIQLEAPGTFAHTLQVRFLAEPASDAIGANTRLISAGVLYHDLGKVQKPEYFVENQMDAPERHRRLRPSVSALLITAHVKDGIELAHQYGLPQPIIDFIPEHHGTTLVSYFYHSAKKNAESTEAAGGGPEEVQESFFRYPGPKPQSRETAIVMLADTVEAASRTLDNPSAARLSVFVHDLIMEKMLDGQLDECDLTFADLARIEEAFIRVLVTRFHSRVRYPGQPTEEQAEAEVAKSTTVVEPIHVTSAGPETPPPSAPPSSRREVLTETRFLGRSSARGKKKFQE